jgi:hypothetical protein
VWARSNSNQHVFSCFVWVRTMNTLLNTDITTHNQSDCICQSLKNSSRRKVKY